MYMYAVDGIERTFLRFADLFAKPLETPFPIPLLKSGSRSIPGKYFQKSFYLSLFVPFIASTEQAGRYYMPPQKPPT